MNNSVVRENARCLHLRTVDGFFRLNELHSSSSLRLLVPLVTDAETSTTTSTIFFISVARFTICLTRGMVDVSRSRVIFDYDTSTVRTNKYNIYSTQKYLHSRDGYRHCFIVKRNISILFLVPLCF